MVFDSCWYNNGLKPQCAHTHHREKSPYNSFQYTGIWGGGERLHGQIVVFATELLNLKSPL